MALVQAKCENCGGILKVDSGLKAANCPYCGIAYVVQDSINYYNSTTKVEHMHVDVVNVSDENSSEGRLKAADTFMRLGDYDKAENAYRDVTDLTPQNYLGWVGLVRSFTHNYMRRLKTVEEIKQLKEYARSVMIIIPKDKLDGIMKEYWDYFLGQKHMDEEIIYMDNKEIEKQRHKIQQLFLQEKEINSEIAVLDTEYAALSKNVAYLKNNEYAVYTVLGSIGGVGVVFGIFIMMYNILIGLFVTTVSLGFFAILITNAVRYKRIKQRYPEVARELTSKRKVLNDILAEKSKEARIMQNYSNKAEGLKQKVEAYG